ncbi:MAG: AAA family ATPase [Actinobacteria bacterium]|nr:AAA family ATPase [Actinomycetota bacterium]
MAAFRLIISPLMEPIVPGARGPVQVHRPRKVHAPPSRMGLRRLGTVTGRASRAEPVALSSGLRYELAMGGPSRLTIRFLGAPEIRLDGRDVGFDTRKAVALLAFLVGTERAHRRDSLGTLLWPEYEDARARAALRRTLSTLRKGLGEGRLEIDRSSVRLDPDDMDADVMTFRSQLRAVEAHDHGAAPCTECTGRLRRAVELYRGDFLSGFALRDSEPFDDWQFFEAESLRRQLAGALDLLAHRLLDEGRIAEAITHARRWVAMDALHEPAHRFLMLAFGRAGDRAAAVKQYRECVRILDEELGVAPLSETTSLYESIAAGEPQVDGVAPAPTPVVRMKTGIGLLPMVGRDAALATARAAYAAADTNGRMVAVEGEAGVGKSRLLSEVVRAMPAGAVSIEVTGHAGESGLAYAVVADALRSALRAIDGAALEPRLRSEIARLVPDAQMDGDPPVPGLDQPGARAAFFDAITSVVATGLEHDEPGALVLDDLQWADEASLDLISFLARRLDQRRFLLLIAWRSEEVGPGHRLPSLVADLRRDGLGDEIRLERLDAEAVRRLASAGGIDDPELSFRLFEETEGLPFFIVEYLDPSAGPEAILSGARDLLTTRLARTSEIGRQVLSAAAVLGGPFDADLLRDASGRTDEETVAAIENLIAIGLLREASGSDDGYAFGHDKMRELVYEDCGPARRRSLHRRAAEALRSKMRRPDPSPLHAALALHLRSAGAGGEAAIAFREAGEHARSLFANEDALRHYEAALALDTDLATQLHEAIGDVQTLLGDYASALMSYERAAASTVASELAGLEVKIAEVHQRAGRWDLAEMHHASALAAADADDRSLRSRIAADRSLTARRRGDVRAARRFAEEGSRLADEAADLQALARAQNTLGVIELADGNVDAAVGHLEQSLVASEELEDPSARIAALNNLASAYRLGGGPEQALVHARAALELCSQQGDRHREAALHSNVADLLHATGRPDEAIVHLKEAAALFTTVGEGTMEPEIWKLVEW